MKKAIMCLVPTQNAAEPVVASLLSAGFVRDDVSVLLPSNESTSAFAFAHGTKAPEGAVAGASTGGVVGGAVGLIAGLGLLAIPGVGPLLAAGPILGALSGAAVGAAGGGIVGGLVGMGLPEVQAKLYEGKVRGGNVLISAHSDSDALQKRAGEIFKAAGAEHISSMGVSAAPKEARA